MKKFLIYTGISLVTVVGVLFVFEQKATADPSDNVSGYAWNSSVGPISMNCTNDNSCSTVSYGVTASPQGGDYILSGQAWNDNVGWISFDSADLGGVCPFGAGQCNPVLINTSDTGSNFGAVTGVARIISYPAGSGFIRFSDTSTYPTPTFSGAGGATYNNTSHQIIGHGYSPDIGVVDFASGSFGMLVSINPTVGAGFINFSINDWAYDNNSSSAVQQLSQTAIIHNGTVPLARWSAGNVRDCVATSSNADASWSGSLPIQTSPVAGRALSITSGSADYTISCTAISNNFTIIRTLDLTFQNPILGSGYIGGNGLVPAANMNNPLVFNWLSGTTYTNCQISTTIGPYPWSSAATYTTITTSPLLTGGPTLPDGSSLNPDPSGATLSKLITFPGALPNSTTAYFINMYCNAGGVNVHYPLRNNTLPPPNVSVSAFSGIPAEASPGYVFPISFGAGNVSSCWPSSIPVDNDWNSHNFAPTSGGTLNSAGNPVNVTMGTTSASYTLTCLGFDGTIVSSTKVVDLIPIATSPRVDLSAFPVTGLTAPATTTLTYESTDTQSCTTTPASTPPGSIGWDVSPLTPNPTSTTGLTHDEIVSNINATTDFFIECIGTDGVTPVSDSVQVPIDTTPPAPPIIRIMGDICIDTIPTVVDPVEYIIFTTITGDVASIDPSTCYAVDASNGNSPVGPVPWIIPANSSETTVNTITITSDTPGMSINVLCETYDGDTISAASLVDLGETIPLCVDDGDTKPGPIHFFED